jgi:hypothetical protein
MIKKLLFTLIILILASSAVSAYQYAESVSSIDMPRVDKTMTIDFTASQPITDRWMNPVDRVVFEENGKEYIFQPVEISPEQAKIYYSPEKRLIILKNGASEDFRAGDAIITAKLLEAHTYKGHFDFSRRMAPKQQATTTTTKQPVSKEPTDPVPDTSKSGLSIWIIIGVAILTLGIVLYFILRSKNN